MKQFAKACVFACILMPAALFAQIPPSETNPPPSASVDPATPPVAVSPAAAPLEAPKASPETHSPHGPSSGNIWIDRFKQSGVCGMIQLLLSVFGAGFVLERFANLRRARVSPKGLVERAKKLWREGKFSELEKLETTEPSTLSRAISFMARRRHRQAADVTEVAADMVGREMDAHLQRTYPIGVVGTMQPLLGLMGMVLGMIDSFEKVAVAGALGNPAQLAAGISEALTTTALGIFLAIIFLSFFHYFRNKTRNYEILLEDEVTDLSIEWFVDKEENGAAQTAS